MATRGRKLTVVETPPELRRGDVHWISFDFSIGSEIRKNRPAVIVSNNASNRLIGRVQVVPLTRNTERVYPSDALVTIKGQKNKALANQITTVSVTRVDNRIGCLTEEAMRDVERAIKIQLGMPL